MPKATQFENLKRPASNTALAELEVEGVRIDLHRKLRLVGFTFGIEPTSATLGWAAVEEIVAVRHGQTIPVSGLALHFLELERFEVSFHQSIPGQLEYFELRHDPEMTLVFFFEGGTVRLSAAKLSAELVLEEEADEDATNLLQ